MRSKSVFAIVLSIVMGIVSVPVVPVNSGVALAAGPSLSAKTLTVRVGKKKTLKVKNTSYSAYFYISSGSSRIKITSRKEKKITIKGVKTGKATIKVKTYITAKKTKTLSCKVTVKPKQWTCPACGKVNDKNYCPNCGYPKPGTATPTPSASASPSPTPTATPVPTPEPADKLSDNDLYLSLNNTYYFQIQLYDHSVATEFYNRVASGKISRFNMAPLRDDNNDQIEKFAFVSGGFSECMSSKKSVKKGDVYLYGSEVLKLALTDHEAVAYPTRIGKMLDTSDLDRALKADVEGKTIAVFMKNIS